MMETKRCAVSYIVPEMETLLPCKKLVVNKCEDCGRDFCEYHARTEMVGNLCRVCTKPDEFGGN